MFPKTKINKEEFLKIVSQTIQDCKDKKIRNPQIDLLRHLPNLILSNNYFKTTTDNHTLFWYREGVYIEEGAEATCKRTINSYTNILPKDQKRRAGIRLEREIINAIKNLTYIERKEFNGNLDWVVVKNGIYDLSQKKLLPHTPEYYATVKFPIVYNPEIKFEGSECEKFIKSVVASENNFEVIQEIFGWFLIFKYEPQKAIQLVGGGANGKTTLARLMETFMGRENVVAVALQDFGNDRFATSELYNKLACIKPDLESTALQKTGEFKAITGGDLLQGQKKFKDPFTFVNFAKLFYCCNEIPLTNDSSDAFYRRWIILMFTKVFKGENRIENYIEKLVTEKELTGLFNWALEGYERLKKNNRFCFDDSQIADLYNRMSSTIQSFAAECLEFKSNSTISILYKDLYKAYCVYCEENVCPVLTTIAFAKKFRAIFDIKESKQSVKNEKGETTGRVLCYTNVGLLEKNEKPERTIHEC